MDWIGRSIIYNPAFEKEIEVLEIDFQHLDDALTGMEWALSNKPDAFPQVYGSKLRMVKIRGGRFVPNLKIWFTFDDTVATIVFGEISQDDED